MSQTIAMTLPVAFTVAFAANYAAADDSQQLRINIVLAEIPKTESDRSRGPQPPIVGESNFVSAPAEVLERTFELLVGRSDAMVLGRATIRTLDSRKGTFRSGGEILIPVLTADGKWKRESREFGTRVVVTPKREENGSLHLRLSAEVSEPDFTKAVTVNGEQVPGFRTRRWQAERTVAAGHALIVIAEHEDATRIMFLRPEPVDDTN